MKNKIFKKLISIFKYLIFPFSAEPIKKGAIKNPFNLLSGKLLKWSFGIRRYLSLILKNFSKETLEKSFKKIFPQIFYSNYYFMYLSKSIILIWEEMEI